MARYNDATGPLPSTSGTAPKPAANNRVDIYVKEKTGSREIRFPWLPEKIDFRSGGVKVATYDIMNKGPVEVPTGSGLKEVSWSSQFPGAMRTDNSMLRGEWKDPSEYHNILEDWKAKGTKLNLLVTGYPINFDAILKDYNATPAGGFGDMEYDVDFVEDRDIVITSTVKKDDTGGSNEQKRPATKTTSYTIKKGDSMWAIAQKFLGSGAKWPTIYQANKAIIDSTAKKYGHASSDNGRWIFPGTKITIPK